MGRSGTVLTLLALVVGLGQVQVAAHCDSLGGPVVADARRALDTGEIAPLLKWIRPIDEPIVRDVFASIMTVRSLSDSARSLADRYFFETIVRLHRAGEGAPYDGLKPGDAVPPEIAAADRALVDGSVDRLARELAASVADGVRARYEVARQRKVHAEENTEAGRRFVAAYVDYVHFVERLHAILQQDPHAPHDDPTRAAGHAH